MLLSANYVCACETAVLENGFSNPFMDFQNKKKKERKEISENPDVATAAVLAQSVERVDCRAGGRGFDYWGRTNTQGLKITEK